MYETMLKKIMEERGISCRMLSIITGIPRSTISNYINRNRQPDIQTAFQIVRVLHLDISVVESLFEPVF